MSNPFETSGMFSWFELMSADVEQSKEFYGQIFDWEFIQDDNNENYTLIKVKGVEHPIAGIFDRKAAMVENPQNIPPHWGNYITVRDIDSVVKNVQNLGGTIVVPVTQIPKVGRFSVIQDPQGAVISLMQYELCEL